MVGIQTATKLSGIADKYVVFNGCGCVIIIDAAAIACCTGIVSNVIDEDAIFYFGVGIGGIVVYCAAFISLVISKDAILKGGRNGISEVPNDRRDEDVEFLLSWDRSSVG